MRYLFVLLLFISHFYLQAQNFDTLRWENRILLLNSSIENDSLMRQQVNHLLLDSAGLSERQMRIYVQNEIYLQQVFPDTLDNKNVTLDKAKFRQATFRVTLIGLDGGIKKVWTAFFKREALYRVIDAMPMRLRETKKY